MRSCIVCVHPCVACLRRRHAGLPLCMLVLIAVFDVLRHVPSDRTGAQVHRGSQMWNAPGRERADGLAYGVQLSTDGANHHPKMPWHAR